MAAATEHLPIGSEHLRVGGLSLREDQSPLMKPADSVQGRRVSIRPDFALMAGVTRSMGTHRDGLLTALN